MTHFLAIGFVRDALHEMLQRTESLRRLAGMGEADRQAYLRACAAAGEPTTYHEALVQATQDVESSVQELLTVLEQFEADPVVYTGPGDTAAVLAMLERLWEKQEQE